MYQLRQHLNLNNLYKNLKCPFIFYNFIQSDGIKYKFSVKHA